MKQKNEVTNSSQEEGNYPQESSLSQKKIHTAEGWMRLVKQKSSATKEKEV